MCVPVEFVAPLLAYRLNILAVIRENLKSFFWAFLFSGSSGILGKPELTLNLQPTLLVHKTFRLKLVFYRFRKD